MHQKIGKRLKFTILVLFFLSLSSIHNFTIKSKKIITNLNKINVDGLKQNLNKVVENELKFLIGKNILFIKSSDINKILKNLNFIKNITVKKKFPSTLMVNAEPTNFFAKTMIGNKTFLINEYGLFVDEKIITPLSELPIFFGNFKKENFLDLKKSLNNTKFDIQNIESIYFFPSHRWDIKLKNGILLKLSNNDIEKSIILAIQMLEKLKNKKNYSIDLRVLNNIIISDV